MDDNHNPSSLLLGEKNLPTSFGPAQQVKPEQCKRKRERVQLT